MVGGFIGLLVVGYLVRFLLAGGVEEYFSESKRVENRLVAALEQRPGDLAILRAMEKHFPQSYDDLLDSMGDAGVAGASDEQVVAAGSQRLRQFMANHKNDFAAAPTPYLDTVLRTKAALLRQLAKDSPMACDSFVDGRLEDVGPMSDAANRLVGESAAASIEAIAAGRRDQQLRLGITPADLAALRDTLAGRGASRAQLAALDSGDFVGLAEGERCDAVLRLVEAIDAQPEASQALLTGRFLGPA
jgi:hypothetical protein